MNPPTYPLRPINGGPLPRARIKPGVWSYEPKINGWRGLVNTQTGEMWNRHGARLSIEKEFVPVLDSLRDLPEALTWLDCEVLERRHNLGRGSLIVFDYVPPQKKPYIERREFLIASLCHLPSWEPWDFETERPPKGKLLMFEHTYGNVEKLYAWDRLQECNARYKTELFEGLVAKRHDSLYPAQLRSSSLEFPLWVKHRWEY